MERYFRCLLPTKLSSNFFGLNGLLCRWHPVTHPTEAMRESENVIWSVNWNITGLMWCSECVNGIQMGQDETQQCFVLTRDHHRAALYPAILWWSAINVSRPQPWPVWGSYHDSYPEVLHYLENAVDDRYLGRDSNRVRDAGCGIILCPINVCLFAVCFVSRHTYT